MAKYREDAEEAAAAIRRCEPTVVVEVKQRVFRRSWYVRVVRDGVRYVYEDIYHYWLESGLLAVTGRARF
ncbi:MAG TPA: hypothetical protein VFB60_06895 [Ktedonobacteraceae bacterium]|nr:hypothetical protein [Ktedonobacteraceae bacterium]